MKITEIKILRRSGFADRVSLSTDLPEARFPFKQELLLSFETMHGTAENYIAEHFPDSPASILDMSESTRQYRQIVKDKA